LVSLPSFVDSPAVPRPWPAGALSASGSSAEKLVWRSVAERSPPRLVMLSKRFTTSRAAPLIGDSASAATTVIVHAPITTRALWPREAMTWANPASTSAHQAERTKVSDRPTVSRIAPAIASTR
jgi:hypothetical protein